MSLGLAPIGLRAQAAIAQESTFATAPSVNYTWIGQIDRIQPFFDWQQIRVYRIDGSTVLPAYILKGANQTSIDLEFNPQDVNLLQPWMTPNSTNSYTMVINHTDASGVSYAITGLRPNTVELTLRTRELLRARVDFYGQQVISPPPSITFPSDTNVNPFYFVGEQILIDSNIRANLLSAEIRYETNLQRVYQFNSPFVRALVPTQRRVSGTITATFDNMTDVNSVLNFDTHTVDILLGTIGTTNYFLTLQGTKFTTLRPDIRRSTDIISLPVTFEATGVSFHT